MKILMVGNGGREHALAWKLTQSPRVQKVYVTVGNGGTATEEGLENIDIKPTDIFALIDFVKNNEVEFTVVGPEVPLSMGIVDAFQEEGLKIFGPTKQAAQLESSKQYAKDFMTRHQIPTAFYENFNGTQLNEALDFLKKHSAPIVIKADGLAAGKGVVVALTDEEAVQAVKQMLGNEHNSDMKIVIEEFLAGEEASFIVLCDGHNILPLATSQDHKRLLDGDLGPNTGGMGAYSPAPVVTPQIHAKIMQKIIKPTIAGLEKEGIHYTGFLYAGVMIDDEGEVKTLEFNCRMGDPETQPILYRLKSDLTKVIEAALVGKLNEIELDWDRRTALGVVIAAKHYPNTPQIGDVITGLEHQLFHPLTMNDIEEVKVFHAGTISKKENIIVTNGGRVLCVTTLGDNVKMAQKKVYQAISEIHFDGMQYRTDIGYHANKIS
jgi:phosphoribosylamine--glycine ligase